MKKILQLLMIFVLAIPITVNAAGNNEKTNNGIPERIEQLEKKINTFEESMETQEEYIKSLKEEIESQKVIIKNQTDEINALKENLMGNNQQLNTLSENLANLNSIVSTFQGKIEYILNIINGNENEQKYNVSGKATFANGYPILSYGIFYTSNNGSSGRSGSVNSDGSFTLNNLQEGTYTLKFGSEVNPLLETVVEVNGNVTGLDLVSELEAVQVKGKMVDSNEKQFVFSHFMEDIDHKIRYSSLRSYQGNEGEFVYIVPKNRNYRLGFNHEEYTLESPLSIFVGDENVNDVTFKLDEPTYSISAQVLDLQGNPISGQDISIRYSTEHGGGTYGAGWRTSEDGEFFLDGLIAGKYTILVGDHRNPMISYEVEIVNSNITELIID